MNPCSLRNESPAHKDFTLAQGQCSGSTPGDLGAGDKQTLCGSPSNLILSILSITPSKVTLCLSVIRHCLKVSAHSLSSALSTQELNSYHLECIQLSDRAFSHSFLPSIAWIHSSSRDCSSFTATVKGINILNRF